MGKKYIIEIPEDKIADFVGSTHFLMPYMMAGHIGHHDTGLPIEPYTEPDLEYVRKEAYEKGYKKCLSEHDFDSPCVSCDEYKRGLADAWEAARKIHRMPEGEILNLFPDCYASVCTAAQAILKYDASEAIAKIKEYEDGKQEIKVGDEVETEDGQKMVIAALVNKDFSGLADDGRFMFGELDETITRTGRHFSEIAAVLEKMRGEQK